MLEVDRAVRQRVPSSAPPEVSGRVANRRHDEVDEARAEGVVTDVPQLLMIASSV